MHVPARYVVSYGDLSQGNQPDPVLQGLPMIVTRQSTRANATRCSGRQLPNQQLPFNDQLSIVQSVKFEFELALVATSEMMHELELGGITTTRRHRARLNISRDPLETARPCPMSAIFVGWPR